MSNIFRHNRSKDPKIDTAITKLSHGTQPRKIKSTPKWRRRLQSSAMGQEFHNKKVRFLPELRSIQDVAEKNKGEKVLRQEPKLCCSSPNRTELVFTHAIHQF